MSKLVTRAASRALGTARRAGVTSRPSPRPTTAFAPSRADPASTAERDRRGIGIIIILAPSPRVSTRRRPRGTAVPAPTTRSLLFPARTRPRAPLGRNRARTRRPVRAHRPRTQGAPSRAASASADARRNSSTASSPRAEAFPIARAPTPRPPTPHLTSRRSRRTRRRVCRVRRPRLLRDRRGLVRQNARLACAGRSPTRLHRLGVPT